jgi:hypothetical protein
MIGGVIFVMVFILFALSFRKDEKNKKKEGNDYQEQMKSQKEQDEEEEERFQQVTNWLESSLAPLQNRPNRFHMLYSSPETSGRDSDIESSHVVKREMNNKSSQSAASESLDFTLSSDKCSLDEKKDTEKPSPPVKIIESDVNSFSSGNWRDLVASSIYE